ncbi:MAG: adenylate/guanylate cyclase domain-containing protein [Geminicoccaceae bacterium]
MSALIDWLLDGAPSAEKAPDVLDQLCRRLRAQGLPLDRAGLFVEVLHPQFLGFSSRWLPDQPIEVRPAPRAFAEELEYRRSPARQVARTGRSLRCDLTIPAGAEEPAILAQLREEGYLDYLMQPVRFSRGDIHAVSWATRRPGGFTEPDLAVLDGILRPFARVIEIMALRRLGMTLLDTYVGHASGERILKGAIRPGDVERILAAIMVSDLREFTAFSNEAPPERVIGRLNAVFGCIVPAVEAAGGEVLKLIGDGLLAIFPLAAGAPHRVCEAALGAARTALDALAELDATPPVRCGLALHVGEVSYGNIGAGDRLDFTAVGPAVNLTARLEPLTKELERPLLVSESFAALVKTPLQSLGRFALRGFSAPVGVYGIAS